MISRRAFIGTLAGDLLGPPLAAEAQPAGKVLELPRFRGHPLVGAERRVHDAEEPPAVPARVSSAAC